MLKLFGYNEHSVTTSTFQYMQLFSHTNLLVIILDIVFTLFLLVIQVLLVTNKSVPLKLNGEVQRNYSFTRVLIVAELLKFAVNDFNAKKYVPASCSF